MIENITPPKYFARLLNFFCERFGMPEIQGDLYELYHKRKMQHAKFADLRFAIEAVWALLIVWRVSQRRKRVHTNFNPFHMFRSNLVVGFRHAMKRPSHTFATIAGLTSGIVACLTIFHYVRFEKSWDRYHEKIDDLAVVYFDYKTDATHAKSPAVPHFVGPKLLREFPEVVQQSRVLPGFHNAVVKVEVV